MEEFIRIQCTLSALNKFKQKTKLSIYHFRILHGASVTSDGFITVQQIQKLNMFTGVSAHDMAKSAKHLINEGYVVDPKCKVTPTTKLGVTQRGIELLNIYYNELSLLERNYKRLIALGLIDVSEVVLS